jgi:hypothetical protein
MQYHGLGHLGHTRRRRSEVRGQRLGGAPPERAISCGVFRLKSRRAIRSVWPLAFGLWPLTSDL